MILKVFFMNRDDVFIDSGLLLFHNFRGNCIDANIIHREEEEKFLEWRINIDIS